MTDRVDEGRPTPATSGSPGQVLQPKQNLYSGLIDEALQGSSTALRTLVDRLTPVIQARVRRALLRRRDTIGEMDPRELLKDLVQDVFLQLWKNDGATLRAWDAARGASLENYVGLVAERKVISHLRRGTLELAEETPEESPTLPAGGAGPERRAMSKETLDDLIEHFQDTLSPLGLTLFELLFVWEGSIQEVSRDLGMKPDAVRKWRTRLRAAAHTWWQRRPGGTSR